MRAWVVIVHDEFRIIDYVRPHFSRQIFDYGRDVGSDPAVQREGAEPSIDCIRCHLGILADSDFIVAGLNRVKAQGWPSLGFVNAMDRSVFCYSNPTTPCGTYISSKRATSSAESFTDSAARASSKWCGFVMPTIGDVMYGF